MGAPYFMSVGLHVLAERRLLVCAGVIVNSRYFLPRCE